MFIRRKELEAELENAEMRAVTHFKKLNAIENILKESDKTKEPYAVTVSKLKELVYNYHNEN